MSKQVRMGFDPQGIVVPIANILPLKQLRTSLKSSQKYRQILSSVQEVGVIEPLNVFPQKGATDMYLLLDGHFRLEALKETGETEVRCLVATDDEAFTYNKRVNRMATIQEHRMVMQAIKSGVSEERIAKVLNVDVAKVREKRDLLDGICREAADILMNRRMSPSAFSVLRKMKPIRQIEAAELMTAASNYSVPYVKAILTATSSDMLLEPQNGKTVEGLSPEQIAKMEREMAGLQRDLKRVEASHGNEVLNLVLACGYLSKLFGNPRVARYLEQYHSEIVGELRAVLEKSTAGKLEPIGPARPESACPNVEPSPDA